SRLGDGEDPRNAPLAISGPLEPVARRPFDVATRHPVHGRSRAVVDASQAHGPASGTAGGGSVLRVLSRLPGAVLSATATAREGAAISLTGPVTAPGRLAQGESTSLT